MANNINFGKIYESTWWGVGVTSNSINWGKSYLDLAGGSFNGLFNQFTGGAFGASLRLLDKNYTGGLLRVRAWDGSADQGEADVMPYKIGAEFWVDMNSLITNLDPTATSRGLSEVNTLADLVDDGGDNYDGFVSVIYEQLNGNHLTQGTATRQGKLVSSGDLNTLNNKPVIHRQSLGGYSSEFAPNSSVSLFYLGSNNNKDSTIIGNRLGSADYIGLASLNSTSQTTSSNAVLSSKKINNVNAIYNTRGELYNLTINQFLLTSNVVFSFGSNLFGLGYLAGNASVFGMMSFQECIVFNNQIDIGLKEENINAAFNIY